MCSDFNNLFLRISYFLTLTFPLTVQNTKFILLWTDSNHDPFLSMGIGRQGFIDRNCTYKNCFITNEKKLLNDYRKFDAVLFYGPDLQNYSEEMLPEQRSEYQKYVFVSDKSSEEFPVTSTLFDGFFNWTWTYKLNSDLIWRHIVVTDLNNTVIGPKLHTNWLERENMTAVERDLRMILKKKSKAVFYMQMDCKKTSDIAVMVNKLQALLKHRNGETLDIFGECTDLKCIRGATYSKEFDECGGLIRNDYYFYIAHEEYMTDDYVTQEILPAFKYNAIPIVYGGANYSRFLPGGSYLNIRELDLESLSYKIYELINNHTAYVEYFKWTNHYKYYSSLEYNDSNQYCELCAFLNDKKKVKETTAYNDFRSWWNTKKFSRKAGHKKEIQNKVNDDQILDYITEDD